MVNATDGSELAALLARAEQGSEFIVQYDTITEYAPKVHYFRIDAREYKVYPPGTTDLDDGAYFVPVSELADEFRPFGVYLYEKAA